MIGTGTAIDSARLKHFLGDILHVNPRSIQAYTMGEHGGSQMCLGHLLLEYHIY
ncbi:hypothetical protein [Lachnoclostridium phytofermentans]|uniref:hypothetical protein n=1 Tax=Lachnoclostridium phytofermentans TaxID=66219 RepID=UPI000B27AF9A